MPLYEYLCDNCGEHFEAMQKFADEPLTTHEKCGGKVQRLLSVPSLQFKGSGFYITDYAKGSGGGSGSNGGPKKGDDSSSSKGESAKSESSGSKKESSSSSSSSDTSSKSSPSTTSDTKSKS